MGRAVSIYFNAVFGALGGLLGWLLFSEFSSREWEWWQAALAGGAWVGAMIGYFVVSADAILDRALVRFGRYAAYGAALGAVGGAIGFWLGDWVNYLLVGRLQFLPTLGAVLARGLGWTLLGLAVGASGGLAARSVAKFWYGTIGGALGGFLGGAVFGWLLEALEKDAVSFTWGQAAGLVILGAFIGGLIALVEEILKPAALRVMRGWREGREIPLLKPVSVVGRDEACDVLLLRDMKIEKRHALIQRRGNRFLLINHAPAQHTRVNDEPIAQSCELRDGDKINLGDVVLRFRMKAAAE